MGSYNATVPFDERHRFTRCAFAQMANDPRVREILAAEGLVIDPATWFVGAQRNTCNNEVTFFDVAPRPEYIRHVTGKDLPMIRGDIRDVPVLVEAFHQARPECVIHLAASVGEANINNVYAGFQVNLVATINVAEAARLAGVPKLVHASTQALYVGEDPKELLYEDSPLDSRGRVYNASKLGCEHVLIVPLPLGVWE